MNIERLKNVKYKTIDDIQNLDKALIDFEKDIKLAIGHIIKDELTDELLDDVINGIIAENSRADKLDFPMLLDVSISSYALKYVVDVNHTRINNESYKTYDKSTYDSTNSFKLLHKYRNKLTLGNAFEEYATYNGHEFAYVGYDTFADSFIEPLLRDRLKEYGAKVLSTKCYLHHHMYVIEITIKNPV